VKIRKRLLELLLATDGLPGWICVGHPDPQDELQVSLETSSGVLDIAGNHSIVALKPLTIALGAENADLNVVNGSAARLVIREPSRNANGREPERTLGDIKLRLSQTLRFEDAYVCLFQTLGGRNFCASAIHRESTYLHERWKMSRNKDAHNLRMIPAELFSMWIMHHVPRPVCLVSYGGVTHGNMFPMDLLGPLSNGVFVLGMHATSPAIPVWQDAARIAVSTVPLRYKSAVYAMGRNHREPFLDAATLPVPCCQSKSFQIPVPVEALSVRELIIGRSAGLGSHVLFLARTQRVETRAREPQMCHVHRFYQQFLIRENRPLPSM